MPLLSWLARSGFAQWGWIVLCGGLSGTAFGLPGGQYSGQSSPPADNYSASGPAAAPAPIQEKNAKLARVKDVATIEGIRDNQLVGYGLVVGLHGTGDSLQTVFSYQIVDLDAAADGRGVAGQLGQHRFDCRTWRRSL